jgi:hypothetical protein
MIATKKKFHFENFANLTEIINNHISYDIKKKNKEVTFDKYIKICLYNQSLLEDFLSLYRYLQHFAIGLRHACLH